MKIALTLLLDPLSAQETAPFDVSRCTFVMCRYEHRARFLSRNSRSRRGTISLWNVSRCEARKRNNGEGRAKGDAEQTGSNLIIRNAPELGNEGLSFRLTPSGLVDVIHLFAGTRGSLSNLVSSLSFRYLASRPCRRVSRSFASRRLQIERIARVNVRFVYPNRLMRSMPRVRNA